MIRALKDVGAFGFEKIGKNIDPRMVAKMTALGSSCDSQNHDAFEADMLQKAYNRAKTILEIIERWQTSYIGKSRAKDDSQRMKSN